MEPAAHLHSGQGEPVDDLQPFPGEPGFLLAVSRRQNPTLLALLPVGLILGGLVFVARAYPLQQSIVGRLCADARALIDLEPAHSGLCAVSDTTRFPLARDLYSAIAAVALGASFVVIWLQWHAYAQMLSLMVKRGSMVLSDGGTALSREVRRANATIEAIGRCSPITILVVAAAITALMSDQGRFGVFHNFAPAGAVGTWAADAYRGWWASPLTHPTGALFYFLVGTWGVYLVTQQNIVGLRIILALWNTKETVSFAADPVDQDGYFGWGPVRSALAATFVELALHGIALACVALTLPPQTLNGPFLFVLAQWAVMLPLHISFPFFFVRRKIKAYKKRETERLSLEARTIDPSLPEHERFARQDALRQRIQLIRNVPVLPFKSPRDLTIFGLSIAADLIAVITLFKAVT